MKTRPLKLWLTAALAIPFLMTAALAQTVSTSLASLPEADMLIYISPQKVLNDAAPRVMSEKDIAGMRGAFAEMKTSVGFDPSTVDYLVFALRFHKPAGDLSFVAPDVMAVIGGDFSADSLFSLAQLTLQDRVRIEKYGSKSMAVMRVDPIAAEAEKMPMLKSLIDVGAVPLSANSLAVGNLPYLKSAIDAADGNGRINPALVDSLMRDPNVLMATAGAPLASFAKAFGLFGTETTPREGTCNTPFGNFYSAVTINGTNFSVRGAMNADNPDTAKIISSLISMLMKQGLSAVGDKTMADAMKMTGAESQMFDTIMKSIKLMPKDNEVVWEADIPQQAIAEAMKPKPAAKKTETKPVVAPRKPVRRKRTR
ncbi:MAG TPA: hypothetical protein VJP89_17510 [Pyrinomonadaceae bacterium]|nr:hypothetical protein [Pyrinomonadaceae bacterium]